MRWCRETAAPNIALFSTLCRVEGLFLVAHEAQQVCYWKQSSNQQLSNTCLLKHYKRYWEWFLAEKSRATPKYAPGQRTRVLKWLSQFVEPIFILRDHVLSWSSEDQRTEPQSIRISQPSADNSEFHFQYCRFQVKTALILCFVLMSLVAHTLLRFYQPIISYFKDSSGEVSYTGITT